VAIKIESLSEHHERATFSCGEPELDDYFRRRAGQDERCNVARVFVATEDDLGVVCFYTLSTCAIHPGELPKQITQKLPRYDTIPAALIGRLARDLRACGRGVGELLVADAIKRVLAADRSMAIWAILVDAKNQGAADFYKRFGFVPFPSRPTRLFLPTATARKAVVAAADQDDRHDG
jgi:GNAT superfamily N-acetyltransferase